MTDMLTFALIAVVGFFVVRESRRDEQLGAALLVGVAVATLLLTLYGTSRG
ncbi:hypothetical protein ACWGQ4_34810 [Streptomyces sp. NPDC055721]|uniref:hypothetical protein n=1 Tax=Streptomyces sp. NPDC127132 TaxID=3345374 RepID=UPI003626A56C